MAALDRETDARVTEYTPKGGEGGVKPVLNVDLVESDFDLGWDVYKGGEGKRANTHMQLADWGLYTKKRMVGERLMNLGTAWVLDILETIFHLQLKRRPRNMRRHSTWKKSGLHGGRYFADGCR